MQIKREKIQGCQKGSFEILQLAKGFMYAHRTGNVEQE